MPEPGRNVEAVAALEQSFRERGFFFPCTALSPGEAADVLRGLLEYRDRLRAFPSLDALQGIFKPHLLARWADQLVHHPAILDIVERLLGRDLLAWSMDIFVRPAAGAGAEPQIAPTGLAWHQDSPYLGLSPLDGIVRAWVALTPTTIQNGTMRYLPGSHLHGEHEHAYSEQNPREASRGQQVCLDIDEAAAVPVELSPGEFSVHDIRTVHDSGENRTAEDRICVALTYVTPDVQPRGMRDSAMLVRGRDQHGHYELEPRPRADLDPDAIHAYLSAIGIRLRRQKSLFSPEMFP